MNSIRAHEPGALARDRVTHRWQVFCPDYMYILCAYVYWTAGPSVFSSRRGNIASAGFCCSEPDREGVPQPTLRVREALEEEAQAAGDRCEGSDRRQSDRVRG